MKKFFLFIFIFSLFVIAPLVIGQENEEKYSPVTVLIEGKSYEIYYKIIPRGNLAESSEYRIYDDVTKNIENEIDFYVCGYRRQYREDGSISTRWNVEVYNTPNENVYDSVLMSIYLDRPRHEARAIYKDIFWQIYEQVGFPEERE